MKIKKIQNGFSLVEILIVISVIGILSALVVTRYNNGPAESRNTVRITTAQAGYDVVKLALIDTKPIQLRDALNNSDGWYRACIGSGYKDINLDGRGDCGWWNNSPYVSTSSNLDTILKKTSSIPSAANYPELKSTDGNVVGGTYMASAWVDGRDMLTLEYALEGDGQRCKLSPLVYNNGSGVYSLTPTGSPAYTESANGITECIVAVALQL